MEPSTCICGNHIDDNGNSDSTRKKGNHNDTTDLEASFVHLSFPMTTNNSAASSSATAVTIPTDTISSTNLPNDNILFNHGLLRTHQYISSLLKVTEDNLSIEVTNNNNNGNGGDNNSDNADNKEIICLCNDCIQK